MEEGDSETRHQDGGRDGDAGEQQHEPDMQARTGGATAALHPDPGQTAGEHRAEQQQDREVGQHEADAGAGAGRQTERRGAACESEERCQSDRERDAGQHQRDDLAQQHIGDQAQPCTRQL